MAAKQIVFGEQARARILAGMTRLVGAIRCTLGPMARTSDVAGDGTTTATLLAYGMVTEGMKHAAAIVANAGEEPSVVLDRVLSGGENFGFNVLTGEYGDLVAMGVLDPCKVTRSALQNAASIAGLVLTTDCMVAGFPDRATP